MMSKKIQIIGALLLVAFSGKAQTLLIWDATEVKERVELSTKPIVTILYDKVKVEGEGVTLEYDAATVYRFTYENVTTSVTPTGKSVGVSRQGDRIVIEGLAAERQVALFTLSGARVPADVRIESDRAVVNLGGLSAGVYLLKANGRTIKITKQ